MPKSLAVLQGMHQLKADVGLMTLAADVAERVRDELGWIDGVDFKTAGPAPIKRDYLFVRSRERSHAKS